VFSVRAKLLDEDRYFVRTCSFDDVGYFVRTGSFGLVCHEEKMIFVFGERDRFWYFVRRNVNWIISDRDEDTIFYTII
jgi:hypothetical protein